ncbi:uncharacterized protein TNCV_234691 [Trichonephila clavipes]|uniref:Uncharacterized protein n=1 Tax=Trichonephila clavipes TaxID=2585209 RepID=A0A8X6VNW8_TRICX|nr:uncharacterized protein TNCV_234691 [Trichonephila clavipes]
MKSFVYNICTVSTSVVIHKQKFSIHGAPKQTYMLFQNDILIDVACHRYTLSMHVSSGTKNNSSPNEPSCTSDTVSFNGVLLAVTGTWRYPYLSPVNIRLQSKPGLVGKHHTRPLSGVHNACSLLQVNHKRQSVAVNGTHLTDLRG